MPIPSAQRMLKDSARSAERFSSDPVWEIIMLLNDSKSDGFAFGTCDSDAKEDKYRCEWAGHGAVTMGEIPSGLLETMV